MKVFSLCILIFVFAVSAYAAKPPSCSDIPISVKFVPTDSPIVAAIWNDDPNVPYVGGTGGVYNTVIHYDGCAGTRDATMGIIDSTRSAWMQFPNPESGSNIEGGPPLFAGGAAFLTQFFMNIRNLTARTSGLVIPGPNPVTFYTRVTFNYIHGPDGNSYELMMEPDQSSCPSGQICVQNFSPGTNPPTKNMPSQTAWAKVTYTPNPDFFVVEGEFSDGPTIERSTLFDITNNPIIHVGQYSMPFKMEIQPLAPLPPFQSSISVNDVSVIEGNSGTKNLTFTISLDVATSNNVSVKYTTTNDTAKAPGDYTSKSGTATIPAGSTTASVTVQVKGDTTNEPDEAFILYLSNEVGALLGKRNGYCTISNDD